MLIVVEKVRGDQTRHTRADYSHLLLCVALSERHLDNAPQILMEIRFAEGFVGLKTKRERPKSLNPPERRGLMADLCDTRG